MARRWMRTAALYLLFFLSGSAALGYQMVWSRLFATALGHEIAAVLALVCAFMGGMAGGAWIFAKRLQASPVPGRWYAALEIVIGIWGLASAAVIPWLAEWAGAVVGLETSPLRYWSLAFFLCFLGLLPATAAMGATFQAMERWITSISPSRQVIGGIYAANTFGAVAGILGVTFVVAPWLGFSRTLFGLAAINILCGFAVLGLTGSAPAPLHDKKTKASTVPESAAPISLHRVTVSLLATGLLGIAFEVVGVRVLAQVLENTIYTFAAVLAVYLFGTSAGAAAYQRLGVRWKTGALLNTLAISATLACLVSVWAVPHTRGLYQGWRGTFGDGMAAVLGGEMLIAAIVFGLPTLFMGALFSHLLELTRRNKNGLGPALALNTLGGASAPILFSVLALPLVGSKWTLVAIACGYLLLLTRVTRRQWIFAALCLLLLPFLPRHLKIVDLPEGGKLLAYHEGVMASAAVVEDALKHRTLRVNNRFQMGGTGALDGEYRQADVPLLLHPHPQRALFLGLGTAITFGAASLYEGLHSDGVELLPEVVEVMDYFEPYNFSPRKNPRLKVFTADARRFARAASTNAYDVIVADLFHPALDGAGSLYTVEHFQTIRARLAAEGLFCQWLPLHQLSEGTLRIIVRSFTEVFPEAQAWLLRFNVDAPVIGLIGSAGKLHFDPDLMERRKISPALADHLRQLALGDTLRLLGHFVAGPESLRAFAGGVPVNRDDKPLVTFQAPRFTYLNTSTSYGRLLTLLGAASTTDIGSLRLADGAFSERLRAYIAARDVYLKGLIQQAEGKSASALDLFVESARLSPDFTSGYAQCLSLASALARSEPEQARALLRRLVEAQPSRPVARDLLQRLSPKP